MPYEGSRLTGEQVRQAGGVLFSGQPGGEGGVDQQMEMNYSCDRLQREPVGGEGGVAGPLGHEGVGQPAPGEGGGKDDGGDKK